MYYIAKVKVKTETDEGKIRKTTETYLVEDEVISGVEAQITKEFEGSVNDWELVSVSETKILKVLNAA